MTVHLSTERLNSWIRDIGITATSKARAEAAKTEL